MTDTDRTPATGAIYKAKDGRSLFIMTRINDLVDVYEEVRFGVHNRVGDMTVAEFWTLVG